MKPLTRKEFLAWKQQELAKSTQCRLCGLEMLPTEVVGDHDHRTGQLRGVIHRSCNSVLGKVERGARYGKRFDPIAFAKGLHSYLTKAHVSEIYPSHKIKRK